MPDAIDTANLRQVPGWKNAPIPICMGGDSRALTFCCKPGVPLTFIAKCRRDESLEEIGLTPEEFVAIKDKFSEAEDWGDGVPCFGSLAYCCMRSGGCPRRDDALLRKYSHLAEHENGRLKMTPKVMAQYFATKRRLAQEILKHARNRTAARFLLEFDI